MPTIPSIRTSIENKDVLVLDEHAQKGTFRRDSRGRLIAYAGGFSVVFPYEATNGEKWAFRCWHSDINNSQKRYEIVAEAIRNANLDFLCEFEYVEKGINVEGIIYPTTRMRWIDGVTIKEYICQNRNSKERLSMLAGNFLKMIQALHSQSLAHGDLQHGNILVDRQHHLYLVDYDSFYCPELRGEADTITGLPDYQHPVRKNNRTVSEKLDYFSELVIYLSILAIAEDPSLVDKYQVEDADRLLFSKEDYEDLCNSEIYKDLISQSNEIKELLEILEGYLQLSQIHELSPFDELLQEKKIEYTASSEKVIRQKQEVTISWSIPFEANVELEEEGKTRECKRQDKLSTILSQTTTFKLIVTCKNQRKITKSLCIGAYDESEISFTADKYYVFPSIPVKLFWSVKHAKKVWLDTNEVKATGSKIVEPSKETSYTLCVEDEFGKKEQKLEIKMLPIPQVKTILAPAPNIIANPKIAVLQPHYNVEVRFPKIEIDWIRVDIPKVPSLIDCGLFRKLDPPLPRCSLMRTFKNVYNHLIK